jgi:hypothetical protein
MTSTPTAPVPAVAGEPAAAAEAEAAPLGGTIVCDPSITRTNADGVKVHKQYRRGAVLGKGGFATCYAFESLDSGVVYAAKVVSKAKVRTPSSQKALRREITIHQRLDHPHIVKFRRFFETATDVYLLMDRCSNRTVAELLATRKRLPEPEARPIMAQLLDALVYLHGQRIVHRDLKPGNLLLDDQQCVRVCDFGLAVEIPPDESRRTSVCGTPNFTAPEILRTNTPEHGFPVDVWAFGAILFALLVGKPPFETRTIKETYDRIRSNTYRIPKDLGVSREACALIRWCLSADPAERPTLEEIQTDPFFLAPVKASSHEAPLTCVDGLSADAVSPPVTGVLEEDVGGATGHTVSVWVKKMVDYSSKYGVGYLLSTDDVGVCFNDGTCMLASSDGIRIRYWPKGRAADGVVCTHADYPAELKKKVLLIQHFAAYLRPSHHQAVAASSPWIYASECARVYCGLLFRLSDGTTQMCFATTTKGKQTSLFAIAGTALRVQEGQTKT